MVFSELEFPEMRAELIAHLQSLADPEYQQMGWVNHRFPPGIEYDDFDNVIHFLYDDTVLSENAEADIGVILKNKEEADAVKFLINEIDSLFDIYGLSLKDGEYMSKPEWENIVRKAKNACFAFGILTEVSPDPEIRRKQTNM